MKKRVNVFLSWHPILAIKIWWAHRQLEKARDIFDRALRVQGLDRKTRRSMIREAGSANMLLKDSTTMLDYEKLPKEDQAIIEGIIARQRARDGAKGGKQGASTG